MILAAMGTVLELASPAPMIMIFAQLHSATQSRVANKSGTQSLVTTPTLAQSVISASLALVKDPPNLVLMEMCAPMICVMPPRVIATMSTTLLDVATVMPVLWVILVTMVFVCLEQLH